MITVNGDKMDWFEGMTVQNILDAKHFTFRLISVWINGEPAAKREDFPVMTVPDGAEVDVIHMMSGG
jgi:sulfur carrier protein